MVVSCDKLHGLPQDGCMVHIWMHGSYVGLRVDSESVTNSEKALFNSEDLPSNKAK